MTNTRQGDGGNPSKPQHTPEMIESPAPASFGLRGTSLPWSIFDREAEQSGSAGVCAMRHETKPRPQVEAFFKRLVEVTPKASGKKLHPYSQILKDALEEYSKTKNKSDIAKTGIISMTMINRIMKGESTPKRLTPKLRSAIEFFGFDADSAWIGVKKKIDPVIPPDPVNMLKRLLNTDRGQTVIDMISTYYRDEFSSVDG